MANIKNVGICLRCDQEVAHHSIKRHLARCMQNISSEKNDPAKDKIFLIKICCGKYFWLYVDINGNESLRTLDTFLRETWLECCGHLSHFIIQGQDYGCDGNMKKRIQRCFDVGALFDYEYDFGSTTALQGEVVSIRSGKLKKAIQLVARNSLPETVLCSHCRKKPEHICSVCQDCFCTPCVRYHTECADEECMLPVVNSPRMGVCGYTGPEE